MNSDTSLVCFKAISNFTSELGELYSSKQRSLKLYCRLIKKTTIVHEKSITKHIDAFRDFCVTNREAIVSKSVDKIIMNKISYSQRVFIDITDIFKLSDKDTSNVIWEHLLCISAIVDPTGKARELLKEHGEKGGANFLTDIINKVESKVDPNANPMEAISSVMSSGIVPELMQGMQNGFSDGSLDIKSLMGAVQGMVGQLGDQAEGDPQAKGAMNMLTAMMGNMGNNENENDSDTPPPDIAGMMQGLMGGLNNTDVGENGQQPDIAGMMKGLIGGLSGSSEPLPGMPGAPMSLDHINQSDID